MAKKSKGVPKALFDLLGDKFDADELTQMYTDTVKKQEDNPYSSSTLQKECVLELIRQPQSYTAKRCRRCGEHFGSSYSAVAYCSDTCRSKAFTEQTGVEWNWSGKTQIELWGGEPPRIINPTLWRNLRELLEILSHEEPEFVESEPQQLDGNPEPESSQTPTSSPQFLPPILQDSTGNSVELENSLPPVWEPPQSKQEEPAQTTPQTSPGLAMTFGSEPESFSFDL